MKSKGLILIVLFIIGFLVFNSAYVVDAAAAAGLDTERHAIEQRQPGGAACQNGEGQDRQQGGAARHELRLHVLQSQEVFGSLVFFNCVFVIHLFQTLSVILR